MAGKRATAGQCGAMRSRYRVHEPERAHFVTSTIAGWLPVFTSPACCEILAGSFAYCREHKGLRRMGGLSWRITFTPSLAWEAGSALEFRSCWGLRLDRGWRDYGPQSPR